MRTHVKVTARKKDGEVYVKVIGTPSVSRHPMQMVDKIVTTESGELVALQMILSDIDASIATLTAMRKVVQRCILNGGKVK